MHQAYVGQGPARGVPQRLLRHHGVAATAQVAEHPLGVLGPARLDLEGDLHLVEVQAGRRPLVHDVETFLLGAREMEDTTEGVKVYSPQSPLGSAIIGHKKGDTVTYSAPNGKTLAVEIVDAVPYKG